MRGRVLIFLAAATVNCDDGDTAGTHSPSCTPGQQVACACPGGAPDGVQTCNGEGSGFDECICANDTTTTGAQSSTTTTGSATSGSAGAAGVGGDGGSGAVGGAGGVGGCVDCVGGGGATGGGGGQGGQAAVGGSAGEGGGDPCGGCDDANACTVDMCVSAVCNYYFVDVDDGDACTDDSCDPLTGPNHTPIPLDDGNVCTTDGCLPNTGPFHSPVPVSDGNACTIDSCDPQSGVLHVPVSTDDGNICTQDLCNTQTGAITHPPVSTDDGDACTIDSCDQVLGVVHQAVDIDDGDACTIDSCNAQTGQIDHQPVDVGDGNACTDDACNSVTGAITHLPMDISDGDACTTDTCSPATGPTHTPNWSPDWNPCTQDSCDPATGLVTRPATSDCWAPISTQGAPIARDTHMAAWTGSKMILWGGLNNGNPLKSGGVYDPDTNTWEATWELTAPAPSWGGTGFWYGGRFVVMGGNAWPSPFLQGAHHYDHASFSWSSMSGPASEPLGWDSAGVVAGSQLLFWGGRDGGGARNSGWVFPGLATGVSGSATSNAPSGRFSHSAVWDGTSMIVYGGLTGTGFPGWGGFRYEPSTDSWAVIADEPPPTYPFRWKHVAVWTGSRMLVWGGLMSSGSTPQDPQWADATGSAYDPATNLWTAMNDTGAPSARLAATAVWTGSRMIVWGGRSSSSGPPVGTGGLYDPVADGWTETSTVGQPSARAGHTAVWTGQGMIVWGGVSQNGTSFGNGAIYYP